MILFFHTWQNEKYISWFKSKQEVLIGKCFVYLPFHKLWAEAIPCAVNRNSAILRVISRPDKRKWVRNPFELVVRNSSVEVRTKSDPSAHWRSYKHSQRKFHVNTSPKEFSSNLTSDNSGHYSILCPLLHQICSKNSANILTIQLKALEKLMELIT